MNNNRNPSYSEKLFRHTFITHSLSNTAGKNYCYIHKY